MAEDQGTTGATSVVTAKLDRGAYRPTGSITAVRDTVIRSLGSVVTEAIYQAGVYVSLADHYDRDEGTAVVYGHLVEASECLEIAMNHLDRLNQVMSLRMRDEGIELPF